MVFSIFIGKRYSRIFYNFFNSNFDFCNFYFLECRAGENEYFKLLFNASQIFNFLPQLFGANETLNFPNTYIKELYSGYATWKTNIIFGGGIESFHINCSKILNSCSSHPHNYYLKFFCNRIDWVSDFIFYIFKYFLYFYSKKIYLKYTFSK